MTADALDALIKNLARGCVLRDVDSATVIDEEATYAIMKRARQMLLDQSVSIKDLRLALAECTGIIRRNGDWLPKWVADVEKQECASP